MKYKVASLMVLTWLICASNSLPAAPLNDGVAAIVDDDVVTHSDFQSNFAEPKKLLLQKYHGDELASKLHETMHNILTALIERLLIIHDFKHQGGVIPDKFLEERIHDVVTTQNDGNESLFEKALTDRSVTLDEYKKEIADNAIVGYMTRKNVVDKVKALKPANPDEEKKLTDSIRKAWIDSLRQQSYVKNFFEAGTSH